MRNCHDFWYFSRIYTQFEKVSNFSIRLLDKKDEVSEETQVALKRLYKKMIVYKIKIGKLNLQLFADCKNCNTGCCNELSDRYFTPIDFWLSKYGSCNEYDYADRQIKKFHDYFKIRFASLWRCADSLVKFNKPAPLNIPSGKCCHLGKNGCSLPHHERPIKCLIYACPRLKKSLSYATRLAYKEAIKDLYVISLQTFNVLKAEAGLPSYYGYVTLYFTP